MNKKIQNLINEKTELNKTIKLRRQRHDEEINKLKQEYFLYENGGNKYRSTSLLDKEIEEANNKFENNLKQEFEKSIQEKNEKLNDEKERLIEILSNKTKDYARLMSEFRNGYMQGPMVMPNIDGLRKEIEDIQRDIRIIDESINANGIFINEQPKPKQPKPEQPKPEQPQAEQPKPEQQKPEQPKPEQPKPEQPKPEQPKPEQSKPEQSKPEQPQLRSFWEIYDSTNTEHCGTISRIIHKMAKAPLFRMKGEDTVQKALSFIPNVLTFIPKILAKPINYLLRTDKKFEKMYDNISALSPEEFEILTRSSYNCSIKDSRDKDFLSPTFMKQYKVNDLYLDAVQTLNKAYQRDKIYKINQIIAESNARIRQLMAKRDQETLSPDEQNELYSLGHYRDEYEQWGDKIAHEVKLMEQGAKDKTSAYRNISGWFLGKFNPDNREFNHRMAELAKKRREAWNRGDEVEATVLTQEMDDLSRQETKIRTIGFNSANTIDRGNTSIVEGSTCEILDHGESTKTRLLIANLACGAAVLKTAQMFQNQSIIDAQKAEISRANSENYVLNNNTVQNEIDQKLVEEAATEYTHKNIASAHAIGEYANLDARAMEHGGNWTIGLNSQEYRTNDDLLHAATTNVNKEVENASMIDGVKASADYYNKVASEAVKAHRNYYSSHEFDYTGYMSSLQQVENSQAIVKLFETLQKTSSANSTEFVATKDLLGGISNSSDYALVASIGAGVLKGTIDRSYRKATIAPKSRVIDKEDMDYNEDR